jgi:hypothetical protein
VTLDIFTSPRLNLYESSDGFSVEVLGRTGPRYREERRQMFVDSEVLTGSSGIVVYKDRFIYAYLYHVAVAVWKLKRENSARNVILGDHQAGDFKNCLTAACNCAGFYPLLLDG